MLRYFTAGESHGPALTAIIEGMPAGLALSQDYIDRQLVRRQGGYGRGGRMKIEQDRVKILSGVRNGFTLGSPITLQQPGPIRSPTRPCRPMALARSIGQVQPFRTSPEILPGSRCRCPRCQ